MAPPKTVASPLKSKARFYDRRFASPIAENRYNRLFSQSTTGIQERGLELDPEGDPDRSMIDTVDVLHWADFINHLTTAGMLSVVQEFYANFANKDADERVFVQGKDIHGDIDCAYAALMKQLEEEFNYDEIGKNLRRTAEFGSNPWQKDSKGQYNNLLLSNLSVTARAWLHFISCRLLPASYRVEVTKDRALLINCRITKQPIDAAQIIIHTMH
ncbi:putative S-locus lectin protein kinase family protein [Senna tora]|uniref:Putative S-locus lectin protein kinase family protein n=1 Tax=Senna tora TaxID=362788 RepID=A0A834TU68_9FABA|nr:putative S-locus lectin protein kinase family protein [Senna tora]